MGAHTGDGASVAQGTAVVESHGDCDGVGQVGRRAALIVRVATPALHSPIGLRSTHVVVATLNGHHVAGSGRRSRHVGSQIAVAPTVGQAGGLGDAELHLQVCTAAYAGVEQLLATSSGP